ncbi:MAG: hypothetical protein MUO36_03515, partial [Candidatus Hadarchaeum sp.]|nr:hypothetical protein [Candidatus Hadarchaeum sp.]
MEAKYLDRTAIMMLIVAPKIYIVSVCPPGKILFTIKAPISGDMTSEMAIQNTLVAPKSMRRADHHCSGNREAKSTNR